MPDAPAAPDELATLYLRARDVPCPGCGYNRRDGTAAACPECQISVHLTDNSADRWLSLSKRRSRIIAWSLLLICIIYWVVFIASAWEIVQRISTGLVSPWSWWHTIYFAPYPPLVVCLPLAAWQLIRLIRCRSDAHMPNEHGILLYRACRWCIIAIGPWTLVTIVDAIWRLIA
ncbi:MAG: hypothetical protein LAT64_13185 [Phycisphaerales bacterium]|nr:hypothetical protein [Planctomycetota bacterium]MCH8509708.1 hypothetical protein [Phycisphaerales bacterium]